jgi:predicted Zn-dependent peptidase
MRTGSYSDLEMNQTKAMIANHLRELQDSANEMIGFDFNAVLSGRERTTDELLAQVRAVTAEQIAAVARKTELDTIYFLRDGKEG